MKIFDIHFLEPYFFLFFLFLFIFLYFLYKIRKQKPIFWAFEDLENIFRKNSFLFYFRIFLIICIFVTFSLILANPNKENISEKQKKSWIDIVLAFDISESMNAVDLSPTRLEAAKKILQDFISKQKTNRVGLVVFSWKPFIWIPLTFDYNVLTETIKNIKSSTIDQQALSWTAIWDAILMAKNMFDDKQRQKVILLLTDGEANVWVDPKIASISARDDSIKIYTIWIWWDKETYVNVDYWFGLEKYPIAPLNDTSLQEISKITSWKFFRALDNKSFENIFNELEWLEKTDIETETKKIYKDIYDSFAYLLAFLIFLLMLSFFEIKKKD